jgi:hypothetical protein
VSTPGDRRLEGVAAFVVVAVVVLVALALPRAAPAAISSAEIVDASPDVLELGGVAMAEDGSGGLVYRKRVEGRAHIYAAQYIGQRWLAPQRIDVGQAFDSSWPRIGAGNGGRLVVTWVQEFGVKSDRMFSASLDPGSYRFQAPVVLDFNVGEATATFPSLAMNRGGSAYLAYRIVTEAGSGALPPGYVRAETRVARYNGSVWSVLGVPVNRNQSSPVSTPTAANSAKVGIDTTGNGIVAFQEPDDEFVDRVWARRLFGSTLGVPLIVSPQSFGGAPLRGAADALSLDVTTFGGGAVAFRQQPGERSALTRAHVFVNTIPEVFSPDAGAFATARIADELPIGQPPGALTSPSVGTTSSGVLLVGFGVDQGSFAANGNDATIDAAKRLDDGRTQAAGGAVAELADSEDAVLAWRARPTAIAVQEHTRQGDDLVKYAFAPAGGPVEDLLLAGSGLGDGLVGFEQGNTQRQITAVTVDAPPLDFAVQTPVKWVRSKRVRITWDAAPNALGSVRYTVIADKEEIADKLTRRSMRLRAARLGQGRHEVSVIATDRAGQESESVASDLNLDRRVPRVRVRRRGGLVQVRVNDGRRSRASGLRRSATRFSFGDGKRARGKTSVKHRYRHGGTYRLVVKAQDRAGNRVVLRRKVRVP